MTAPVVQRFFETPVITVQVDYPDEARVAAVARALVDHFTVDVSHPATPRFDWQVTAESLTLAAGETTPMTAAPGLFWVGYACLEPGDGQGGLAVEDPRRAMIGAGTVALDVSADPWVDVTAPKSGELTLVQAFLRHGLSNSGILPQQWVRIALRARPCC